jgi:acetyl esterase/lipase
LLLYLARSNEKQCNEKQCNEKPPAFATLISPWVTLVSPKNLDTPSDYLNADVLHHFARQYAGSKVSLTDPLVSPGTCNETEWWRRASPSKGFHILFGTEEVFAIEIRGLIEGLKNAGVSVEVTEAVGGIHVWPVTLVFLSDTKVQRQKGLKEIVRTVRDRI